MMKERLRRPFTIVFVVMEALLLIAALFWVDYGFSRFNDVEQIEGWEQELIGDDTLRMTRVLGEDTVGKAIMFYTSDAYVTVTVDGEVIYTYGKRVPICRSPGSLWQFIELPSHYDNYGRELCVEIHTVYPDKFNTDIPVYGGSSGALMLDKVVRELPNVIANLVLFIYGILMIIIYWLERSSSVEDSSDYLLGVLAILTCFWSNCELFTFQLVFPSGAGQYFLYYLCFFAMPMCLIVYMESLTQVKVTPVILAHVALIAVLIVLQITGVMEFTQSLVVFLAAALLEMVFSIIYQVRRTQLPQPKGNQYALAFFVVCVVANSMMYFINSRQHVSLLVAKIGLIVYVTFNTYLSFEHLIVSMVKISESEKVREIAFMDQLTQIGNRYAFMQDIETTQYQYIGLVSIDLNNLKYYNDSKGHIKGDQLIKDSADILKKVYEGSLYRTGGDEFISITAGKTLEELEELREKLHRKLDEYNQSAEHDMILEIAVGFSVYEEGDSSYEDILARADEAMYADKAAIKAVSPIKSVR